MSTPTPTLPGLRLLLLSTLSDKAGGAEFVFASLSRELACHGLEHAVANNGPKFTRSAGGKQFLAPLARIEAKHGIPTAKSTFRVVKSILYVFRLLIETRPNIVNIHYVDTASVYIFIFRFIFRYKIILTCHGSDIALLDHMGRNFPARFVRWALGAADAVSAVSPQALDDAKQICNSIRRTFVTPNGIDLNFWCQSEVRKKDQIIVSIGALRRIKGHDILLKALNCVHKEFPSLKTIIIGEGPERNSLEKLSIECGVKEYIEFLGQCTSEKVRIILGNACIFVMPSRAEGFGIAALEAMASGVPVIACRVGGLPSVVKDGETGLLVPPESPSALADAICTLLRRPDQADRFSERARKSAKEFSLNNMAVRYQQMYRSVLSDG